VAEVAVTQDGRVHMLDAEGQPVTVDKTDLGQALQAGYQPEDPKSVERRNVEQTYGTLAERAKTFGEGALEGATLGVGNAGLAAIMGDDYKQNAQLRAEVNPGTRTAGSVVGAVAPALASGGESAVARGVSALGAPARAASGLGSLAERGVMAGLEGLGYEGSSVLGRMGAKALSMGAGAGVENALYGAGTSLEDSVLGDSDWTADKAMSAMADQGWYGFAGGAAVGGAGSLLASAGKRVLEKMAGEGKTFQQAAGELAERRAAKSVIGNNQRVYNELTDYGDDFSRIQRMGRKALDADIPLTNLEKGVAALGKKTDEAAERLKGVAEQLDTAGVKVDAQKVLSQVDDQIQALRNVDLKSHHAVADRLESEIAPIREALQPKEVPTVNRTGEKPTVEFTEKPGKEYSFSEWWKLRQKFDETLNWAKRGGDPATDSLRKLRSTLDEGLDDALAQHADLQAKKFAVDPSDLAAKETHETGSLAQEWKSAKEDYGDFVSLKNAGEEQLMRGEKNRWISPSDYGVAATGANILGTVAGIASGSVGIGALTSMASGAASGLASKFFRERGAGMVARMADAISKFDARTGLAAKVMVGAVPAAKKLPITIATRKRREDERAKNFTRVNEHVQRFASDPMYAQAETQKVIKPWTTEQPGLASKIAQRYQADMAYLAEKAPKPYSAGTKSFQPLKTPKLFSRVDKQKFLRIASALSDPADAIDDIAQGDIDLDVIEALKERRPEAYADLRTDVMTEAAKLKDEMPFARRNFLSIAFDYQGDPSLDPQTLASIQSSTMQNIESPDDQGGSGPPKRINVDGEALQDAMTLPSEKQATG